MEDSFKVRVDKIFGSLASSSSASTAPTLSASLSSLWSLTDDEIERDQWKRDTEESQLVNTTTGQNSGVDFRSQMEQELDDLDDEIDADEEDRSGDDSRAMSKPKPDDYNDEQWEIKNSIGTDPTLDNEEEEDEYDKVAVGRETAGDESLIREEVDDYGIDIDSCNEIPTSFLDVIRDPRANHMAAKLRLKEDAEAAKKMNSLRVSEEVSPVNGKVDGLKSILKKRDSDHHGLVDSSKSGDQKRVRFEPECEDNDDGVKDTEMETDATEEETAANLVFHLPPDYPSGVPDYMRNPLKYTKYTFDPLSNVDEESNRQAFFDMLKATGSLPEEGALPELPKSVAFVPRKKPGDIKMADNFAPDEGKEPMNSKDKAFSIAAADVDDGESCAMEENELESLPSRKTRRSRHYRIKANEMGEAN